MYKFRRLNSTDLFPMVKIIGKIGLDEIAKEFNIENLTKMASKEGGTDVTVGFDMILTVANIVLQNLPKCEKEIYTLLSSVSGMSVDEVRNLDLDVFLDMIIAFIKKEEFKDFFKAASKYIKA